MKKMINTMRRKTLAVVVGLLLLTPISCGNESPSGPAGMFIPAMGLYTVGTFSRSVIDVAGLPVTVLSAVALVATNQVAAINGAVTLFPPVGSPVPLGYQQSVTHDFGSYGSYSIAMFADISTSWTGTTTNYVPGGVYSMSVSTNLGVASATAVAPGPIDFSANGASVTWSNADWASANVMRQSPNPALTYTSGTANLASPFTFPAGAYLTPSTPATFLSTLAAATTVTSFTGTSPVSGSAFIWMDTRSKEFTLP